MGWFISFIDSSLGKKLIMAVTGLFLYIYLIIHLVANLFILAPTGGPFNAYAEFMASNFNIPVRIIEVVLFIAFIYHILNGIRLWFLNRSARDIGYEVTNPSANSSFYSRFMIQSGIVVGIFLVLHLLDFFIPSRFGNPANTMYDAAVAKFQNTGWSIMYIVAMILLAFHLVHAFQSGFQTLGLRHNKYTPFIKGFGVVVSILICAGFALIPLYFILGGGR
ncbi:MAG TPA: succinate dehydrogenase cytochrome b subunit [Ignavibacteriaceae bacterium]|nr:succinate dehydrogenase cytochrome b subunit [Ignavibacteriaceae bacterium]